MPSRQEEDPLVAVILPDRYDEIDLLPTASDLLPTASDLLPTASDLLPSIDSAIECATRAGVDQIYVLSANPFQRDGIKWIKTEAKSEGDAMRDLDSAQVIRSDFLLIHSVCTFDLTRAVEEHRSRRKADKDSIMTICCMRTRFASDNPIFFVDSSNQIQHYAFKSAALPMPSMDFDIRSDLVESVKVCSIDVPPLFTENFDYQTFADFTSGIITSDLLTSKIHLKILHGYGAPCFDRRWTHSRFDAHSFDADGSRLRADGGKFDADGSRLRADGGKFDADGGSSEGDTSDESISSIGSESDSDSDEDDFGEEARASLERALEEGHRVEDAALELKTLRMASNVSLEEVREVVIEVLLGRSSDPKEVQTIMARWAKLIALVSDDEVDAICQIQSYCAEHSTHTNLFIPLLKLFYNNDIFDDDSFIQWWRSEAAQTEANRDLRNKAQGIIRHILEE